MTDFLSTDRILDFLNTIENSPRIIRNGVVGRTRLKGAGGDISFNAGMKLLHRLKVVNPYQNMGENTRFYRSEANKVEKVPRRFKDFIGFLIEEFGPKGNRGFEGRHEVYSSIFPRFPSERHYFHFLAKDGSDYIMDDRSYTNIKFAYDLPENLLALEKRLKEARQAEVEKVLKHTKNR